MKFFFSPSFLVLSSMTAPKQHNTRVHNFFENPCARYSIIFLCRKMSIETNISKNGCFHRYKSLKDFGRNFLVLPTLTTLREQYMRVHKLFWHLLWKLYNHFFRTWEVGENTNFSKKGNLSSEEKILAYYFTFYRVWQTCRCRRFSDKFFGTYRIISVTPKVLLGMQSSEKEANF